MFIAEQQLVSAAVGFQVGGRWVPFASTFAAFLSRAYDFVRMAAISRANLRLAGSHAGVSIGEDGPSQMALEDIAALRAVHGNAVLHPSDANQVTPLVVEMATRPGISYMRTLRGKTPVRTEPGDGIRIRVIDCYSIKPIDTNALRRAAAETGGIVTVEDHWPEGGLGEAVESALADAPHRPPIVRLAVREMPTSGSPAELLHAAGID